MSQTSKPGALINWIGYLAVTMLLLLPVSVLTVRSGAWQQGLLMYALSCLGCLILLGLCGAMLLLPRYANSRGAIIARMVLVLPGTALLIALLSSRGDYPPIHDITTDTKDPPVFTAAVAQRGEHSNPLEIDPQAISAQREAYPDVQTIRTSLEIETAFDRALAVAGELGWDVYHQDRNAGIIEAVETTAIMAFKDDIVIRVRSNAEGTLVDLRSVSRVGIGDIGANAKRIRAFQQAFAP